MRFLKYYHETACCVNKENCENLVYISFLKHIYKTFYINPKHINL